MGCGQAGSVSEPAAQASDLGRRPPVADPSHPALFPAFILAAVADDTNPKRQRGRKLFPHLRFGLVWNVSLLAAGGINQAEKTNGERGETGSPFLVPKSRRPDREGGARVDPDDGPNSSGRSPCAASALITSKGSISIFHSIA